MPVSIGQKQVGSRLSAISFPGAVLDTVDISAARAGAGATVITGYQVPAMAEKMKISADKFHAPAYLMISISRDGHQERFA